MEKTKRKSSIKFKILSVPLIIVFIVIAAISIVSMVISKNSLMKQMKTDSMILANQIESQINTNNEAMDSINGSISDKIRTMGAFIIKNSDKVSNEYLIDLAKQFEVDEINYCDTKGKIIYSNLPSSIGSVFDSKHIAYSVFKGDKEFFVENIRKSRETDDYFKYGYVGKRGVGTVQVGIISNKVQKLSESVDIQKSIELLTKDESIVFASYIDKDLTIKAHSDTSKIGGKANDTGSKAAVLEGENHSSTYLYNGTTNVYDLSIPVYDGHEVIGAMQLAISMETVNDTFNRMLMFIIIVAIVTFVIATLILFKISKGITEPLQKLVFASEKIAKGDLSKSVKINSNDEIGILYNSFSIMTDYLKDTIQLIKEDSAEVSNMSSSLSSNSKQMTHATGEVTSAIQNVSQGAMQQAGDLVDISDNISMLANELDNIYNKINGVKDSSSLTQEKANIGKKQIDILLKAIEEVKESFNRQADKIDNLNSSVSKVGNITNVINEISEQTNLLALNAAIEAARAGEAGKGFAVVSEEVRKLAEQSKESTEKIQRLVQVIITETKEVLDNTNSVNNQVDKQSVAVKSTISAFDDMLESLSNIGPFVEDAHKSLQTTMKSKNSIVATVDNVTSVSQETSAASEEIAAASEEVLISSEEVSKFAIKLENISKKLSEETNRFKI